VARLFDVGVVADLDGYSKGELNGFLDPLPPLPLLTKEGSENREKLPSQFNEALHFLSRSCVRALGAAEPQPRTDFSTRAV